MYVIVGGGRIGRELAEKIPNSVIIERNPDLVSKLRKEGFNVIEGDAINEEVLSRVDIKDSKIILATNDDFTNILVAEIAKNRLAQDIVARVENPEYILTLKKMGIQVVLHKPSIVNDILSALSESDRRYFEVNVKDKPEFLNKQLKDVSVNDNCVVISIFREGKIYRPHPNFTLTENDVLGLLCSREVKETRKPFNEILVILRSPNYKKMLEEAKMVAKLFNSDIFLSLKEKDVVVFKLKEILTNITEMSDEEVKEVLKEYTSDFDLIITGIHDEERFSKKIKNLIKLKNKRFKQIFGSELDVPVILSKGKERYNEVLAVLNTSNPVNILNYVRAFSRFCNVKLLILDEESLSYKSHLLESFSNINSELVKGNPVIEFVKEAKRDYDLVIFSIENDVGNVDEAILWKVATKTQSSVMVVR